MFNSYSRTGVGVLVIAITFILQWLGVGADEGTITALAVAIMEVVGILLALYGQWSRKDLEAGLIRKV